MQLFGNSELFQRTIGLHMSEHQPSIATIWKPQVVHPEVPGHKRGGSGGDCTERPNVEARVLEERIIENVGKILDCASSRQRLDNSSTGSNGGNRNIRMRELNAQGKPA